MTHREAVRTLTELGYNDAAEYINAWRSCRGNTWGWDGHLRLKWPLLWDLIFPPSRRPKSPRHRRSTQI